MRKDRHHLIAIYAAAMMFAGSCTNNPYRPGENAEFTFFGPFSTPPTKLDPASAYYVHEGQIIDQIYEPPFTYHYLKRPYELIPLTAECIPEPEYFDNHGKRIHDADPDPNIVVRTEYTIKIKKGIMYQNHPCFALNDSGAAYYENIGSNLREKHNNLADFEHQSTRELLARDYVLQIRRLADPRLASPVFSTIARYVLGLEQLHDLYAEMLARERERRRTEAGSSYNQERDEKENPIVLDYMKPDLPGVMIINSHTYKIILMRKYPQILYWMCMHFFGPMPEEAIKFYALPTIAKQEFSINKSPVGTGPYYLKVFKPNEKIVLEKNPNYHDDFYPTDGAPGDEEKGLLRDAGKRIPFIHRQVLRLEKEAMPTWSKFLQGYYDSSSIANDVFDQAVQLKSDNDPDVSPMMSAKGIRLITDVDTMFWYTAFNMLDPIVGGYEPGKAQLRQAISIALDYNEYLDIFANGRGVLAQGPIPPGIFGYRSGSKGANPFVDEWDLIRKRHVRQSIEKAQQLM
ncbi:MAG: peptide ABC transporter substrate-binding protein, partial [Lentisphaerae bacterium]|nr:peptide ABC transporter substrate-binding protein [Lentisphaerota bacterium]